MTSHGRHAGFTLIEVVAVVAVIAIVMAVALPRLLPVLAFGTLDGAARHLAAYGRSASAYSALSQKRVVVIFDLDEQAYWTVEWLPEEEENRLFEEREEERKKKEEEAKAEEDEEDIDIESLKSLDDLDEDKMEKLATKMAERFDLFVEEAIKSRANNVKNKDGILSDVGDIFEKEFKLDETEDERKIIGDMLLLRVDMNDAIRIESIEIAKETKTSGQVEVVVSPLGISDRVFFRLRGERNRYYSVEWDPILGSRFGDGKDFDS